MKRSTDSRESNISTDSTMRTHCCWSRTEPASVCRACRCRSPSMNKTQRIIVAVTALLGISHGAVLCSGEPLAVRVVHDKSDRPYAFEVVGLSAEQLGGLAKLDDAHERFSRILAVIVVAKDQDADLPAVAGSYSVEGTSLRFTPRFAFR